MGQAPHVVQHISFADGDVVCAVALNASVHLDTFENIQWRRPR
jgi:hypothetical protein